MYIISVSNFNTDSRTPVQIEAQARIQPLLQSDTILRLGTIILHSTQATSIV